MKKIILLFISILILSLSLIAAGAEQSALFLDSKPVSENMDINEGTHTLTAEADGDMVFIAVYESGVLKAVSINKPLIYNFSQSGTEIRLFNWDKNMKPLTNAVCVVQNEIEQLIYRGKATCIPDEWEDFDAYIVRLTVVKTGDKITEIKDIEGYEYNGNSTNKTNASYLKNASKIIDTIIAKQTTNVDAVSGATCASYAIMDAVDAALKTNPINAPAPTVTPEAKPEIPDGAYMGSAQCIGNYINYMVDVEVNVKDGKISEIQDKTLKIPMSSKDRELYQKAWNSISESILYADNVDDVDMISGATISSAGILSAVENALNNQTIVKNSTGDIYAPEGISLYARVYPVVTVENGQISDIRIVPAKNTDTDALNAFAENIKNAQSVRLEYPDEIKDDAYNTAALIGQILYGKGVLNDE